VDNKPVANAGPDVTIALPTNTVTLDGSGSTDDKGITSYTWKTVEPETGSFTMEGANTARVTLSNLADRTYIVRLTVADKKGQSSSDNVTVIVESRKWPLFYWLCLLYT